MSKQVNNHIAISICQAIQSCGVTIEDNGNWKVMQEAIHNRLNSMSPLRWADAADEKVEDQMHVDNGWSFSRAEIVAMNNAATTDQKYRATFWLISEEGWQHLERFAKLAANAGNVGLCRFNNRLQGDVEGLREQLKEEQEKFKRCKDGYEMQRKRLERLEMRGQPILFSGLGDAIAREVAEQKAQEPKTSTFDETYLAAQRRLNDIISDALKRIGEFQLPIMPELPPEEPLKAEPDPSPISTAHDYIVPPTHYGRVVGRHVVHVKSAAAYKDDEARCVAANEKIGNDWFGIVADSLVEAVQIAMSDNPNRIVTRRNRRMTTRRNRRTTTRRLEKTAYGIGKRSGKDRRANKDD